MKGYIFYMNRFLTVLGITLVALKSLGILKISWGVAFFPITIQFVVIVVCMILIEICDFLEKRI